MMSDFRTLVFLPASMMFMLLALLACETSPPVQEMSDARQAIAVAREAGAADLAAAELKAAEDFLESAQKWLNQREYEQARQDAMDAKIKAQNALKMAEAGQNSR